MKPKGLQGKGLATFFEYRGKRIAEAGGVLWHEAENRMYMSLPYTLMPEVSRGDLDGMLRQVNGIGVRYPSRTLPGLDSGIYVCRERDYSLTNVQSRLRSMVRKGLQRCEVREVAEDVLEREGLALNLDTMERQGRHDIEFADPAQWKRLCQAITRAPKVRAMGSFVDGKLGAYAVVYEEEGWTHILHQNSLVALLEHYPNHALAYTITSGALARPEIQAVSYGLRSIVNTAGLHDFKLRLGFDCDAQNSVCYLHPALAPMLTSGLAVWSLKKLRERRAEDQKLQRIEAVIQAARAGRLGVPMPAAVHGNQEAQEEAA